MAEHRRFDFEFKWARAGLYSLRLSFTHVEGLPWLAQTLFDHRELFDVCRSMEIQ